MRFNGVTIPPGITIIEADIQFRTDEISSNTSSLKFEAQAANDAPTFVSTVGNISSRPRTTASMTWSPSAWETLRELGPDQKTPDISAVIQEIVDQPGWISGTHFLSL